MYNSSIPITNIYIYYILYLRYLYKHTHGKIPEDRKFNQNLCPPYTVECKLFHK